MTTLLVKPLPSFAVLAADQLAAFPDGRPPEPARKLVCHKRFPLAFGVRTGAAHWPGAPGQPDGPIIDLLTQVLSEVASVNELVLEAIADRVKAKLQPGYEKVLNKEGPEKAQEIQAEVAIALFKGGKVEAGLQYIGCRQDRERLERGRILCPPSLALFYDDARCARLRGLTVATEVIQEAGTLIDDGNAEEENTAAREKRQPRCGFGHYVVVVDEKGARPV